VRESTAHRGPPSVGYDLVIFDCDGVLVDSERLAIRIEAAILTGLGWPMTQDEVVQRFVGRSAEYMQSEIERTIGRPIDWDTEFESRYREVFSRELLAVDGVEAALSQITAPVCVASSGTHEKIRFSLGLTGLLDRFEGHIFSVEDVAHGKPAPDLFLYAADHMGHAPVRCAVIEDSASGVAAGLAAGMTVFAFAGGVTPRSRLALDGVVVFEAMAELPGLLQGTPA
jgi:HAD superfamily hydrolase (TIGR01509 family)